MQKSMKRSLTKRLVDSLKATSAPYLVFDDALAGFGVRVMPTGRRSYFMQYRNAHGASRWLTIGHHGKITADEARTVAKRAHASVAHGEDPSAERKGFRDAPDVDQLLDRYIAEHVTPHNRATTAAEVKRLVKRHIRPAIGKLKVAAVARHDAAKLHRSMENTPRQANFVRAICSKAFSLAEDWEWRPQGTNPCAKIKPFPENKRERFLNGAELVRLGSTLRLAETAGLPWTVDEKKAKAKHLAKPENRRTVVQRVNTAAVELLLYTGCRLSEVLNLRWDQVDFDAGTVMLLETKAGGGRVVVLNPQARQVLKSLKKIKGSPWVLPSRADKKLPLSKAAIEGGWQRIRVAAGLSDVRLHDLRHTFGTYAGQSGANSFVIRDALGHKDIAMTARYVNAHQDPVRILTDLVGERIEAGLEGRVPAEVIAFKRGA